MKLTAIGCLLLLTGIPVAAWAAACCPPEHEMGGQAVDDCVVPATSPNPTFASLHAAGKHYFIPTAVPMSIARAAPTRTHDQFLLNVLRSGDVTPAASRDTTVLLL
jgi:hypothetical protein